MVANAPYSWDERAARWRDNATGRFVSPQRVREALEGTIDAAEQRMLAATRQLMVGEITRADWQAALIEEIKDLFINAARAASGGELAGATLMTLNAELGRQALYLARLGSQLENNAQPPNGVLLVRAGMYAHAARGFYELVRRQMEEAAGMDVEWNERGSFDSCHDCIQMTRLGKVPIGTLIPIGARQCLTRCRCTIHYGHSEE